MSMHLRRRRRELRQMREAGAIAPPRPQRVVRAAPQRIGPAGRPQDPPTSSPQWGIDHIVEALAREAEKLPLAERDALAARVNALLRAPPSKRGRRHRLRKWGDWRHDPLAQFAAAFVADNPDANPHQVMKAFATQEAISESGLYSRVTAIWGIAQRRAAFIRGRRELHRTMDEALAAGFPTFDDEPISEFLARWQARKPS